jgi:polysaccharide export outer membrane protein
MMRGVAAGVVLGLVLITVVPPARAQEYTIGPGDVLDISVLGEWNAPAAVNPDGKIVIPLAGEMSVTGLTLSQATEKVTAALRPFIKDPQVMLSIRQAASRRQFVYLLGQVLHPGAYEMQKEWTVAELIAVAGGPTPGAALTRALILRKSETVPIDLDQLLVEGNASANVALNPGDVVIVPETKNRVVVMGGVAKPGPYLFKEGDHVVDALSAAGGPTPKAVLSNIGIVRLEGQKPAVKPVNLDKFYKSADATQNIVLRPGDVVYVPEVTGMSFGEILSSLGGLSYLFLLLR